MDTKSDSIKFNNCQHSSSLLQKLNDLRGDPQFCDVILICNGTSIRAHKNILAAASPYFLAMFSGRFPESDKKEIVMQDIKSDCLKAIVDYMYSGTICVNVINSRDMLITASFLQLEWVESSCALYMINMLEPTNCLGLLQFAEQQSNNMLLSAAEHFTIKHFQQVMRGDEFLELTYDELSSFLDNDEIFIHSEDALLVGLSHWVEHKSQERLQYLPQLINHLHPACVSEDVVCSLRILCNNDASVKWRSRVFDYSANREWNIFVLDKMGRRPDFSKFDLSFGGLTALKPLPEEAFAVSLTGHKNFLYVQGGSAGRSRRVSFYYNIYRDLWHTLQPLIEPRSHHRSIILGEFLYALGGNSKKGATNSVECLDLETNIAMHVESMLSPRSSMGAVALENCVFVMGGENDHRSLHSMERYDPREGIWHSMSSLSVVNSYCTSAVIDNLIYCCEGLGNSMERYDLRAEKWEMIDFCDEREFYEIFAVNNNLYSVSGEEISCYSVDINQWRTVYEFPVTREWDTAVGMQVINYCL